MESKKELDLNVFGLSWMLIALGLIQSWKTGVPWYVGLGVSLLVSVLSLVGLIPVVGVFAYWVLASWLVYDVIGVGLSWVVYGGLVFAVIYTVFGIIVLGVLRGR